MEPPKPAFRPFAERIQLLVFCSLPVCVSWQQSTELPHLDAQAPCLICSNQGLIARQLLAFFSKRTHQWSDFNDVVVGNFAVEDLQNDPKLLAHDPEMTVIQNRFYFEASPGAGHNDACAVRVPAANADSTLLHVDFALQRWIEALPRRRWLEARTVARGDLLWRQLLFEQPFGVRTDVLGNPGVEISDLRLELVVAFQN